MGDRRAVSVGDIHWVDLPSVNGHEQRGRRPAVILPDKPLYPTTFRRGSHGEGLRIYGRCFSMAAQSSRDCGRWSGVQVRQHFINPNHPLIFLSKPTFMSLFLLSPEKKIATHFLCLLSPFWSDSVALSGDTQGGLFLSCQVKYGLSHLQIQVV